MPYDEEMARRVRVELEGVEGLTEKKMFGGIGWMIHGNLATGVHSDGALMIRCTKEDTEENLARPGAYGMMRGGKPMAGWILVEGDAVVDDEDLATWVARGCAYAQGLPPKKKK